MTKPYKRSIVIVERNHTQREALVHYLKRASGDKYDFVEFDDCTQAWGHVHRSLTHGSRIAAIITHDDNDYLLDMKGVPFIEKIRKIDKDVPVYLTSGRYEEGELALKAGATGFFHRTGSGISLESLDAALQHIKNPPKLFDFGRG